MVKYPDKYTEMHGQQNVKKSGNLSPINRELFRSQNGSLGTLKFKDDGQIGNNFDTMADSTGYGLISTLNMKDRPTTR